MASPQQLSFRDRVTFGNAKQKPAFYWWQQPLTWVWEGGKPFRPYTPINASFWREMLNLRNCGWSIKSCDLQKIPGGTSWIALRPISSSPESMVLFSCVNPPNFPECERPGDEGKNIKITGLLFRDSFSLIVQEFFFYLRETGTPSLVFRLRTFIFFCEALLQ